MDPDDHEPAGAANPEGRVRSERMTLETKQVIAALLLRVKVRADLSTLQYGALANGRVKNVSAMWIHGQLREFGSVPSKIMVIHMLVCLEHHRKRIK
jgi:hypothetical protein